MAQHSSAAPQSRRPQRIGPSGAAHLLPPVAALRRSSPAPCGDGEVSRVDAVEVIPAARPPRTSSLHRLSARLRGLLARALHFERNARATRFRVLRKPPRQVLQSVGGQVLGEQVRGVDCAVDFAQLYLTAVLLLLDP